MPIFLLKDGQQYGPYEPEDVRAYVDQGSFQVTDLCWQDGWSEWQPLSTIIPTPPPPQPIPVPVPSSQPYAASAVVSQTTTEATQERVLWEGRASLWKSAGSIIWSTVVSLVVGFFTLGIGLIIAPIWWVGIYLARKRRKYTVTTKRVKAEFGILAQSSTEIRIKDIRSVNVVRKGLAGIIGIGTVEFSSAAGTTVDVTFQAIANAGAVKKLVDDLQG